MDFDEFYKLYPRRMARKKAEAAWRRLSEAKQFAAMQSLPIHIRYWEAAGTTKEFLPYPATWLNEARWEDELEMPAAPEEQQWWRTRSGIEARARQRGVSPKPGEDHDSLKARILAMERA